jgi:hypothetical protein
MPICWLVNRCWSVSDYDDSFEQSNDRVVGGSDSDKGSEFFGELFDHFFATLKNFDPGSLTLIWKTKLSC